MDNEQNADQQQTTDAVQPKALTTPPETVELTTPNGTVVVLRGYITGGDMEELQRMALANIVFELDPETHEPMTDKPQTIPAAFSIDRTRKALELLVVSVNGDTTDPAAAVRNLPVADYQMVRDEVNRISSPLVKTPPTAS